MRLIRRRGLALTMISGLAAGSILVGTSQAAATDRETRPHRSSGTTAGHPKEAARHETHTVARGNTLWEIADRHYGDGMKWWAVFGANAKAIEKGARDHGREGSDLGHWIFPDTELALPDPETVEVNAKVLRAALDRVLAQHPRLAGSLCPEAEAPGDVGECLTGLLDRAPLLIEQVAPLLEQAPLLLEQVAPLLDRIDLLEEVPLDSLDALLKMAAPLLTCVTETEDPVACLTEATQALTKAATGK